MPRYSNRKRAKQELNPFKCYQLDDYYKVAECISFIAANKSDEKLCEDLEPGFGKVQNECYAKVAMSKNDLLLNLKVQVSSEGLEKVST